MQTIVILKILLQLLPLIIQAVKAIEAAFPAKDHGADKLDLVKETVSSAYEVEAKIDKEDVPFDKLWPAIQKTIDLIVKIANKTGTFQTKE